MQKFTSRIQLKYKKHIGCPNKREQLPNGKLLPAVHNYSKKIKMNFDPNIKRRSIDLLRL